VTIKLLARKKNLLVKMCKEIFFQIFLLFTIFLVNSNGNSEPYLDILKHYKQNLDLSDLCSDNLSKLKSGYENREIWAIKGD
jgi:hypothetical protein